MPGHDQRPALILAAARAHQLGATSAAALALLVTTYFLGDVRISGPRAPFLLAWPLAVVYVCVILVPLEEVFGELEGTFIRGVHSRAIRAMGYFCYSSLGILVFSSTGLGPGFTGWFCLVGLVGVVWIMVRGTQSWVIVVPVGLLTVVQEISSSAALISLHLGGMAMVCLAVGLLASLALYVVAAGSRLWPLH